ncbi:hypothetical protein [Dulcicalothrix desertica]|uniref:hypothetical protein n=1 Tax=Dulcicalothrix desertica TaxID=32056 RepID=UPI0013152A6F|nr:hypothetical protein [Dulcicalothrix desertica]
MTSNKVASLQSNERASSYRILILTVYLLLLSLQSSRVGAIGRFWVARRLH